MASVSEAHAIALQHHQAGRLDLAEEIYRRILQIEPNHGEALHLAGLVAYQRGRHQAAVDDIVRAIAIDGRQPHFHSNLGEAYRALGNLAQAIACYQRALELNPGFAKAHNNLGEAYRTQGKLDEAIVCYRRSLELSPDSATAHNNLGVALHDQGRLDEAIAGYRRAIELMPDFAEAHNNLGIAWRDLGRFDEAIACYRRALKLKPDFAVAYNHMGIAWRDLGEPGKAIACYQRALELISDRAEVHNNLGMAWRDLGELDEAIACHRRALKLKPDYAEAHNNLGVVFYYGGRTDEAIACYQRALQAKPDFAVAHSNYLNALHYRPGVTPVELLEAHLEYERRHAAPLRASWRPHDNSDDPERPLRLGFVSPCFARRAVARFLLRALENRDCRESTVVCYSDGAAEDDATARFQSVSTIWRDVSGVTDGAVAEQIRADRIDILFDLAGHTGLNRLLVFARKPAPIQVTWLDYVGTTGLGAMDYILADAYEIPPGGEAYYCEKVLRLPDSYVCYDPPPDAPPVGPLPALANGLVTFGSFNFPSKFTPQVVGTWARILREVPQARVILKYPGLESAIGGEYLRELFADQGISPRRVEVQGGSPSAELLACYQQVDVALDPFPYNGGLTTCDALWMGVPVITCPGQTFASRHGLSHLSNIGLTETIARDLDEYVRIAARLAEDLPRLAAIRVGLRQRVAGSPLCDGKRFATNLTGLLRGEWRRWVARQ